MHPAHPGLGFAHPRAPRALLPRMAICAMAALLWQITFAQAVGKPRTFNIPVQGAESALKVFSEQSGKGVIMNASTVDGIRTNQLKGAFTPLEALRHLLAGTGLIATPDEKSGAFVVHHKAAPPSAQLPPPMTPGDQAKEKRDSETTNPGTGENK